MKGRHQVANACVALAALNALPPPFGPVGEEWPASFAHAYVAGRFDVRGHWIFDVAHNPDGPPVPAQTLRACEPPPPPRAPGRLSGARSHRRVNPRPARPVHARA